MKKLALLLALASCSQTYVRTTKRCAPLWPAAVDAVVGTVGIAVAVDGYNKGSDAQTAIGLATFAAFAVSAGWACSR